MSYLVTVTFDLHGVADKDWEQVYKEVYAALAKIGLSNTATTAEQTVVRLPQSTVMGEFQGESARTLRNRICWDVEAAFKDQKRKYTMLATVGNSWALGHRTG